MQNLSINIKRELGDYRVLLRSIPSLVVSIFIVSVIMMNLLANKELFVTEYVAIDCGTTLSWIPFLCMDTICRRFGPKAAVKISLLATAINLACCIILYVLSLSPGMWGAYYDALAKDSSTANAINESLNSTIGGCWYVVLGSTLAMVIGSLVNSGVFHVVDRIDTKGKGFKAYALRAYTSTIVAQLCDNFVFTILVSHYFFGWTMKQVVICSIACALIELVCEMVFSPLGYRIARNWEIEGVGSAYLDRE